MSYQETQKENSRKSGHYWVKEYINGNNYLFKQQKRKEHTKTLGCSWSGFPSCSFQQVAPWANYSHCLEIRHAIYMMCMYLRSSGHLPLKKNSGSSPLLSALPRKQISPHHCPLSPSCPNPQFGNSQLLNQLFHELVQMHASFINCP